MIGKLKLGDGSEAVLEDDGKWRCHDEVIQTFLNIRYSPDKETGPGAVLPYGVQSIHSAASALGAKVIQAPKVPPLRPGEIS